MYSPELSTGVWTDRVEWHEAVPTIPSVQPIPVQTLDQGTFKEAMVEDEGGEQGKLL